MSVVAIIQARMTSSRFPGKVLRNLAGRPLLWHIVTRVSRAETVDRVVVACSTRTEDDAIETFCRSHGWNCVRGSETDVLARFRTAAGAFPADTYVRICGDSPLVSPEWIDRCVHALETAGAGYTRLPAGRTCVHEGVDVLSGVTLQALFTHAAEDPVAREHVTGYFKTHPDFALAVEVPILETEERETRLSVDVPEDLEFFARLYALSGAAVGDLTVPGALAVLQAHPEVGQINAGVRQRRASERPPAVLLYGEGGAVMGWGHLSRLSVLARSLRRAGADLTFAYEGGADVAEFLEQEGVTRLALPHGADRGEWLARQISAAHADVVMIDTCGRLGADDLRRVRATGVRILLLDDVSDRVRFADAVYTPPAPQCVTPPDGYTGEWHSGWDCVPLRDGFRTDFPVADGRTLLVTMGGSDPRNFTLRAVRALSCIPGIAQWRIRIVLGRSYGPRAEFERELAGTGLRAEILAGTTEMAAEMAAARAVLLSFGVTAYEGAAVGRPMACYCLSDDHRRHATIFERHGLAMVLGDEPGEDAAALHAWLQRLDAPMDRTPVAALRRGTDHLTAEILRWARCARPLTHAA